MSPEVQSLIVSRSKVEGGVVEDCLSEVKETQHGQALERGFWEWWVICAKLCSFAALTKAQLCFWAARVGRPNGVMKVSFVAWRTGLPPPPRPCQLSEDGQTKAVNQCAAWSLCLLAPAFLNTKITCAATEAWEQCTGHARWGRACLPFPEGWRTSHNKKQHEAHKTDQLLVW